MDIEQASAIEFFREQVDSALCNQHVLAPELTVYYLVQLLAGFVRPDEDPRHDDEPLALMITRLWGKSPHERRNSVRRIGDRSLFISGFYSDSLNRKLVDVDYYVAIGTQAYGHLSTKENDSFAPIFADLAERFVVYVDVMSEVSERLNCTKNTGVLRLYEKWLKTGSTRAARILTQKGIVPNTSLKKARIH
jgi:hypothetical protein